MPRIDLLLAHAVLIEERQPAVDGRLKEIVDSDVRARLDDVEAAYQRRFGATVEASNRYRKILYGWSSLLVFAVSIVRCSSGGYTGSRAKSDRPHGRASKSARRALGRNEARAQIQEALVPKAPALANCEVAATMKAIDDVGGDYYDIITTPKSEWILIGDVSGHGVPAGLIMMMCHTAVRTVLRVHPEILPDTLLGMVNTVLTETIHKLGEDKYMTLSALRRDPDGTVLYAGAHQDMHIYRAESAASKP